MIIHQSDTVMEDKNKYSFHSLWSVMFSPVNASLIVVAGTERTRILDIRNTNANSRWRSIYIFI